MEKQPLEKIDEHQFLTTKSKLGYAEEYIVVKRKNSKNNLLLNYSLSNSLEDIKIAIYARTGQIINLNSAFWEINTDLSVSVKHLMNSHHVNYSMTIAGDENDRVLVVNMRVGDNWFFTEYIILNGKFIGKDSMFKIFARYYNENNINDSE